jgi:hypothetical protein
VLFVALESLNFGPILLLKSCKKSTKSDQGCLRGGHNWSKGVPPRGSEKQVGKKTRQSGKQPRKWLQHGTPNCKVGNFGGYIFRYFPASFLRLIFNGFYNGFGSVFWINFMLYLDVFGYFLKLAALAKSAPRPHGSMVLEVLTLRFLSVFS